MQQEIIIERLKSRRTELGITQAEAAKLIGVSQPAYQRYENGIRTPSIQVVKEMAKALNTSVDYLSGKSEKISSEYLIINRNDSPLLFSIVSQCMELDDDKLLRLNSYFNKLKS